MAIDQQNGGAIGFDNCLQTIEDPVEQGRQIAECHQVVAHRQERGERGLIGEPVSLSVLRDGVEALARLISDSGVDGLPVIGIEATGALHRAWAGEVERRWPGSLPPSPPWRS